MAGYTLHVISHSHWDREWYMPFELHRRRLVKLLDALLDVFDRDPEFGSFHLDGQSIPLEDYLEIRPHQRERLRRAAGSRRLTVGPWYVLQDEYLTSGEAQVRNLLYGSRLAAEFGPPLKVGYLADAFGNIGQMPQLLRGFGIDNAVFGRGLNRLNPDAPADADDAERGYPSEVAWRSPDGSEVLGIFMANWYSNAMDIPAEPEACVARFEAIGDAAARMATTPHLLLMNGCDHTPCQLNISELIRTAQAGIDDVIVHDRLDDYAAAVREAAGDLPIVVGELRSEFTNGWGTLTNVLSSRLYLKQANARCQDALEHYLEPLQAVLSAYGVAADRDFRRYLWKLLLQNHPHDSICGCSVDAVHSEMETRFQKVEQLSGQLIEESLTAVAARVDTTTCADDEVALVVHNPLGFARRELVTAEVSFPQETQVGSVEVTGPDGAKVPCQVAEDLGEVWDYDLPDDRFRIPYTCRRLRVELLADVPAFGYATYRVKPLAKAAKETGLRKPVLENEYLKASIQRDGTLDLVDKRTGRTYAGLNALVFGRDQGDEYNYRPPQDDELLTLDPDSVELVSAHATPVAQTVILTGGWELPCAHAHEHDHEHEEGHDCGEALDLVMQFTLPVASPRLEIKTYLANYATQFRLRAHFPTGLEAELDSADGHFEVVRRKIVRWRGWENPSNCQPCQAFVDISDAAGGLTVANRGLPEYEVLRDGQNTIAITLLRATGELGDWGDFPTPGAQCQGDNEAEYALVPHAGPLATSGADAEARAFVVPLRAVQTGRHAGDLPPAASWLKLEPASLVLSAVRAAEDREGFLVRFYNPYETPVAATLTVGLPFTEAWRCNLDEQRGERLGDLAGGLALEVGPKEIVTIELA